MSIETGTEATAKAVPNDACDLVGSATTILDDLEKAEILQRLLDKARALHPRLRQEQAATEERRTYSPEIHQEFLDAGFYRILQPKAYGGFELGVAAFHRVQMEVARGCLSTAWCLGQASAHNLTIASYWPEEAQKEIFVDQVLAPGSAQSKDLEVVDVPGGICVSGIWQYASGSPYSTHFMGTLGHWVTGSTDRNEEGAGDRWFVAPRGSYEVLDDWGAVMGLKGSGSHSVRFDNAFIPEHLIVPGDFVQSQHGPTVGSILHQNSVYAGAFQGLDEPAIAAGAVGLGYAAVDEFERIAGKSKIRGTDTLKIDHTDYQRAMGMALGRIDTAAAAVLRAGRLYEEFARLNHEGIEVFSESKSFRVHESAFAAERLVWEALVQLMRTAGSSSVIDGSRLQRYFRDLTTMTTRVDQFEFDALLSGQAFLKKL